MRHTDEKILGISMSEYNLVLAEIGRSSERLEISQLASLRMEEAFDFSTISNEEAHTKVAGSIESALRMRSIQANKTALSLPDRMALVHIFPVDAKITEGELQEHVRWEIEQFLLADQQEYIKDVQRLPMVPGGQHQMMLVAVRKLMVDSVKKIFAKTSLKLIGIDIDMFSAVRAVEMNYGFRQQSKAMLIQFNENSFHILQLMEGKFLGFESFPFIRGNGQKRNSISLLAEEVYKKIDHVLSRYFHASDQSDLDRILIFGRYIPTGLVDELQELCPAPVDTVNPFNRIRLSAQAEQSRGTHDFHDFLVAVGTALRGVRS